MAEALRIRSECRPEPTGFAGVFAGEHAWCAEKLTLSDHLADAVSLPLFFRGDAFRRAIDRYAVASGGSDRRAVISMWSLYYFSALAIPHLIARQLGGRFLPVAFDEMTIALHDDGLPRAFGVPHDGWREDDATDQDDCFEAVGPLVETHLVRAVEMLKQHGISGKLCWNNAAVYIDYVLRLTQMSPEPGQQDLPLFVRGCLPGGGINPLSGCIRQVEEGGECVSRRKVCCLRYMLPAVPSCGRLCALPEQRRQ
jgi:ferric iron reductase protein FhuF